MNFKRNHLLITTILLCAGIGVAIAWAAAQPAEASHRVATPHSAVSIPAAIGTPVCGPQWNVVLSQNQTGATYNTLNGVAVISSTEVWAAGYFTNTDGVAQTLIERWDGTQWSIVPSPNVGDVGGNFLQAISASSANNIWAVGFYQLGTAFQTLIIRWNGVQWDVVSSPKPSATENYIYGVTAISANDAHAVGYYNNGTLLRTMALRWNGTAWSTVSSPNPTLSLGSGLRAVTAVSANEVWAVGAYVTFSALFQTYIIRWNGSSWSAVNSPNSGSSNNALLGVSASASNNVWAVGTYSDGTRFLPLIERWNGSAWSVTSAPGAGTGDNALGSALAVSANEVWAVGGYFDGGVNQSLALRWNGTQWAQVPSENPSASANAFFGVGGQPGNLWAVGSYSDGSVGETLVERYADVPCQTGTPTHTPTQSANTTTPTATATTPSAPTSTSTPQVTQTLGSTSTATPTPTAALTSVSTTTSTTTSTSVATSTTTSTRTRTPAAGTPTPTGTPCNITFSDVQPSDYFHQAVTYLACRGVISGYADGTFRPYNNTTRGQLSKIIVLAEGWELLCPPKPQFTDVDNTNPFYCHIETAFAQGIISGYADGTFRPGNNVTRAQLCKIIVLAEGWTNDCPPPGHFTDVLSSDPFFCFIETAFNRGIITGYSDSTFRPGNNATRGQISKIVYQAITQP